MISGRREALRIVANYLRIALGFGVGLVIVRTLVGLGEAAFGVFSVVVIGAGVSIMLRELMRIALVPGLTRTWSRVVWSGHGDADAARAFAATHGAALVLSVAMAAGGLGLMGVLYALLGRLSIAPEWLDAAGWFVIWRAVQMAMAVTLAPVMNMLLASQRQVQANVLMAAERLAELAGITVALAVADTPQQALVWFGGATAGALALVYAGATVWILRLDRAFLPRPLSASRAAFREFGATIGWSAAIVASMNLYFRFDIFFVNIAFGAAATVVFGIGVQLTGYVAQLTQGLVQGLDAVFARGAAVGESEGRARLTALSTRLQGLVVFLALGFLAVSAPDLVVVWLGGVAEDPATLATAAAAAQVMALGIGARSLTTGWMAMMAGEGRIGAYAPWLLPAAIANPVLVWAVWALWPGLGVMGTAWVFAVLQILAHGVAVTWIAARVLGTGIGALLAPLALPLAVAVVATGTAWIATGEVAGALPRLALSLGLFAVAGLAGLALTVRGARRG